MQRRRKWLMLVGLAALAAAAHTARGAEPEIVVAIRYLQGSGTSHSHLYLYREDGKLLRQLTQDDGGQDEKPVFAPDGETIVFTREVPGGEQWWSVRPHGDQLHRLGTAPEWYTRTQASPYFAYDADQLQQHGAATAGPAPTPDRQPLTVRAPDGSLELTLTPAEKTDENGAPEGTDIRVRDLATGQTSALERVGGGAPSENLLSCKVGKTKQFLLLDGPLRVAFYAHHLDSTTGTAVYALDLAGKRVVPLGYPSWALPTPLPGEGAFLTQCEVRYRPFGDGQHTANCSYVERWDQRFEPVRYARGEEPAVCYGASMYRPGKEPATVNLLRVEEDAVWSTSGIPMSR